MATPENSSMKRTLAELGGTGLRHSGGDISEETIIRDLQWPRCVKVFKEMESDSLIAGALFAIRQFIRSSRWKVEEYSGPNKPASAAEDARFVEECLGDLDKPFSEVLTDILSFLTYGFSVHEIVYKKRQGLVKDKRYRSKYQDGMYGWRKFPIRSQDTIEDWDITPRGDLERIRQHDPYNGIDVWIPEDRFLLFRTNAYKDNPRGLSVLRSAYRSYYLRKNIEIQEAIGVERDLSGIPVLRVPDEILRDDADESEKALRSYLERMGSMVKRNEQAFVMLPSNVWGEAGTGDKVYDIELLSSSGARQVQTGPVIERYDRRILQSICADVLLVGGQSVGSYSLASTKADIFKIAIESYLDTIADQFNEKAIPLLFELNGKDPTKTPKMVHSGIEKAHLPDLADFLKKASEAGFITPDDGIENDLRGLAGFDELKASGEDSVMQRARQRSEMFSVQNPMDETTNEEGNGEGENENTFTKSFNLIPDT
ncbi:MAG: hypothetical protein CMF22_10130 [Idiomarinaceae bacterium]|mgnify:CR=1 FL=1|nr:hypothetical protein [Idiomarinaceae bacterium]MBG23799.1 hypothetical protein [Idiomarinaceae bacterium]|tara:strand:+ start:45987 stop:47441 length:1455 start_codon:yes stop_codon:yes gene_type:complete